MRRMSGCENLAILFCVDPDSIDVVSEVARGARGLRQRFGRVRRGVEDFKKMVRRAMKAYFLLSGKIGCTII